MLIENQNVLNEVDLESNSTKNLKLSHENQTKSKVSITPIKLNVPIGMKHFTQMVMMMNLATHTAVVPPQTAVPHLTKCLMESHQVICKRKKIENSQRKGRK